MELQGFGTSLVGRSVYVYAASDDAWVPWEFVSGVQYSVQILVRGTTNTHRLVEVEHDWNVVVTPQNSKDWSILATLIKGMGGTVLLVFDTDTPKPPPTFLTFLDGIVTEGRTVLTRIWLGRAIEIPCIPDAVFFPVLSDTRMYTDVYELLYRLPARNGHEGLTPMTQAEWISLVQATVENGLGIMISDVGETSWSLFWHKLADSRVLHASAQRAKAMSLMRTGMRLLELSDAKQS